MSDIAQYQLKLRMTQPIVAFETELLNKIQFKASSKVSMDAFLFKAFKFFDFSQTGSLAKNDFFKAIAKCGVVVDTHDMEAIYKHYAAEDGKVNYKQFIEELLFREEEIESNASRLKQSQKQPELAPEENVQETQKQEEKPKQRLGESKLDRLNTKRTTYSEVLNWIRSNIQNQGMGSLLSFAVTLKSADTKRTHLINRKTLQSALPFLVPQDVELIFRELSDNNQEIDYSVLVYDLKGQLEENRLHDVERAFHELDTRMEGEFSIAHLLDRYLSKREGDNFKRAVDLYTKFQGIDDGVFTEEDFVDFLGFLSCNYPDYNAFNRQLMKGFYEEDTRSVYSQRSNRSRDFPGKAEKAVREQERNFDFSKHKQNPVEEIDKLSIHEEVQNQAQRKQQSRHSQAQKKEVSNNQVREVESIILRIKKRLSSKGTRGYLLFEKALKAADLNRDTLVSYDEFAQVIREQRIDITNTETGSLFDVFDEQATDQINYQELLATIRGNIPPNRKALIDRLWEQVRLNEQSTSFSRIKQKLNFRCHPDVQNGRKYEQDLWKQIQQTILTIQELSGLTRSDTITHAQFEQYLENLSLSVADDQLYESLLYNFWRLSMGNNITEQYAGSRKMFDPTKKGYLMDHHRGHLTGGSVSQNAPFGTSNQATNYLTEHRRL